MIPFAPLVPLLLALASAPAPPTPGAAPARPAPAPATPAPPATSLLAAKLQAMYDDGDDPGVKQLAEERLKTSPDDQEARLVYARTLVRLGLKAPTRQLASDYFTRALEQLITVRTRLPGRNDVRLYICDVFFHARRPDMLLTEANALLKENPADEELRGEIAFYAEQYMSTNQAKNGAAVYSLLARDRPASSVWAANEGTSLLLSGDIDAGVAALLRAARLNPKDAETAHNLAQAYVYRGDWAAASTWYDLSAKLDPERGRYILDQAVARALVAPDSAPPLFDRAMQILGSDASQKLIVERLGQGMTIAGAPAELLETFARELDKNGYPIQALFAIERTVRAQPGRTSAVLLRADILERMRFFSLALKDYAGVHARLESIPEEERQAARIPAISGEARCLTGTGEGARALEVLRANGGEEVFPFETADALIATNDRVEAREILERLSNRAGDRQAADTARQRLRALLEGAP